MPLLYEGTKGFTGLPMQGVTGPAGTVQDWSALTTYTGGAVTSYGHRYIGIPAGISGPLKGADLTAAKWTSLSLGALVPYKATTTASGTLGFIKDSVAAFSAAGPTSAPPTQTPLWFRDGLDATEGVVAVRPATPGKKYRNGAGVDIADKPAVASIDMPVGVWPSEGPGYLLLRGAGTLLKGMETDGYSLLGVANFPAGVTVMNFPVDGDATPYIKVVAASWGGNNAVTMLMNGDGGANYYAGTFLYGRYIGLQRITEGSSNVLTKGIEVARSAAGSTDYLQYYGKGSIMISSGCLRSGGPRVVNKRGFYSFFHSWSNGTSRGDAYSSLLGVSTQSWLDTASKVTSLTFTSGANKGFALVYAKAVP